MMTLVIGVAAGCGGAESPGPAGSAGLVAAQDTGCKGVGFAVSLDDSAVGVPLGEVPGRVRVVVAGLRATDEIREPAATDGPTATWHVVRAGRAIADVSFFHADGDRGWLVESARANTCDGLSVWPH